MTSPGAGGPLRVLVVTNLWPERGGFRGIFVREQVEAVRNLGHHVDVEVVAQSRGRADYLAAVPRVRQRVLGGGYDVVHIHYGLAALAARFCGSVPRVLTLHGSDVDVWWQRLATRIGAGGVAERMYGCRRLAVVFGDEAGHVVPTGVDLSLFREMDRGEARASLGLPTGVPIVLFGAHPDNRVKGYDVFCDVLAELRRQGIPARELILAERDQPRAAVPVKYASADLLLCTSRKDTESGPAVVKEAAAMGLPVVSVDVGDVAEVLDGVQPSAVVPFPEPWGGAGARHDLVDRLAGCAAGVLRAGTRSDGRSYAARFDIRRSAQAVVAVYRKAVRR